jgi:hypothetical protein
LLSTSMGVGLSVTGTSVKLVALCGLVSPRSSWRGVVAAGCIDNAVGLLGTGSMVAVGAGWGTSDGRLMACVVPDMRDASALWLGFSVVGGGLKGWRCCCSSRRRRSSSRAAAPVRGGGECTDESARRADFVGEPRGFSLWEASDRGDVGSDSGSRGRFRSLAPASSVEPTEGGPAAG